MRKMTIFLLIIFTLCCVSCDNIKSRNIKIVKSYIEFTNKGDESGIKKLLSDSFDSSKTIFLKMDFSLQSINIENLSHDLTSLVKIAPTKQASDSFSRLDTFN